MHPARAAAGDFGWVVKRHAELYAQEYRWGEPFEGVCAQIVADFVNKFDAKRERCWIAEMNGGESFARRSGYTRSRCGPSSLTAARHIYQKAGFKLIRSEQHKSWGPPVVSEYWDLVL